MHVYSDRHIILNPLQCSISCSSHSTGIDLTPAVVPIIKWRSYDILDSAHRSTAVMRSRVMAPVASIC